MRAILDVILLALQIYVWLLIAAAVLSWLIAFNVVNTRNQFVATVGEFLYRITEPALRPIRNLMPNLGGIDISPVILILIIFLMLWLGLHSILFGCLAAAFLVSAPWYLLRRMAERRRLVLPIVRRPDRELQRILRPCGDGRRQRHGRRDQHAAPAQARGYVPCR